MPRYIRCVEEDAWLTRSRSEYTWRAVQTLANELASEYAKTVKRLSKRHVATLDEVKAWTQIFFKVRDYKPSKPPTDFSRFYTPVGDIDVIALAKELNINAVDAAILIKKIDKALMVAALEEILQAVKHSNEFGHKIEFSKSRV